MANNAPVLELSGIVKEYPGVRAVDRVDLSVLPGEVHALIGENGAGKSTLIKILAGAVVPDAGELRLRGALLGAHGRRGLSFIHQELQLISYLSAAENIFLGRPYPQTPFGTVAWRALHARARALLAQLGTELPVDVPVSRLTRGEQAMVAIARAFAEEAAVIVMDEPTASLTAPEVERLFGVVRRLRAEGVAVIYVSHRLSEVVELADRVTVMRNGRVVTTLLAGETDEAQLVQLMIGQALEEAFPPPLGSPGDPLLEVTDLSGGPVRGASFTLRAGEVLGVGGLVGAGRSELLRLLFGADARTAGTMRLHDTPFAPRSPAEAIARGVVLVPEERRTQALILSRSICDNMTLPHLDSFAMQGWWLRRGREQREGEAIGRAVQLRATGLGQHVGQLSGGNQKKVVFARWLLRPPQVMLLDEPTRGIDVGARLEIYRLIRQLAGQGMGIVMVSSDWQELLGMADRVLLMRAGQLVAELPAAGLTQEQALNYCYGGL
jgi:ABC-type sugar transport system ATPase subunit